VSQSITVGNAWSGASEKYGGLFQVGPQHQIEPGGAEQRRGPDPAATTTTGASNVSSVWVTTRARSPFGVTERTLVSSRTSAPAAAASRACTWTVRAARTTPPSGW
jgi:hypothetical protein